MKNKWRPKEGERYWTLWFVFEVVSNHWNNDYYDRKNYRDNNCFKTKTQAQKTLKKIKQILNN